MKKKIVFMGSMRFAVPILEGLNEAYEILKVVTQPDKPVGRKKILTPTPVKAKALELGLDVFQPANIKQDNQCILDLDLDFIIVAAYGQFIPEVILKHAKYNAINVHASLLPKYRGGSPMHRAIQYGDKLTGVSIMYMAKKMDAGDVLLQRNIPILRTDNVGTIEEKLGLLGTEALLEVMSNIESITPVKQDISKVTFAKNITPEEERINFNLTAKEIFNHVRGFNPWPLTYCLIDDLKLKLYEVDYIEKNISDKPGEIVEISKKDVYVQTKDGLILLKNIQLQGKKQMDIKDFMNGIGKQLFTVGKQLN